MIEPGERTLGDLLAELAGGVNANAALTAEGADGGSSSVSYSDLELQARRIAAGFRSAGVNAGDCVLVHLPNSIEAVMGWLALTYLGAVFVPSNMAWTQRELQHVVSLTDTVLAVTRNDSLELVEGAGLAPEQTVVVGDDAHPGRRLFAELAGSDPIGDRRDQRPEDVVEIVFTSGTSAAPRGVMITHGNCLFSGWQKALAMEVTADDRLMSALPLFHVNAQSALLTAFTAGASFVMLDRYSASRYCAQLAHHSATLTSFVGAQVRTMLLHAPSPADRAHSVRRAWFAINVSDAERRAFEERFAIRLVNGYGLSEAFTSVTQAPLHGADGWPAVGRPLAGRELRITGPDGHALGAGEVGEIQVHGVPGRTVMLGYWRDPDATRVTLNDGWLNTGDFGFIDVDGYLHFVERKIKLIKRAGENISAAEVERVLSEHPQVAEAVVLGVPDELRDEAVQAFVVLTEGATVSPRELEEFCRERLATFKVPTQWAMRDQLPKNAIGKVNYRKLREELTGAQR